MTAPLERLSAALADRYAIERELGAGGMATVYLAEDLRHHRKVALKVLRPEIAATLGAGRFAREVEVAARLQHPNILPLHDSGEAAGFFFYVMPFVEGESLRDRLARGGELPIPDAVRILMEVADALSHAHAHGVVHRDIKPDNVMLVGRHAVVTDFGVAKAVTEATGRQVLTSAGVALGTPAYMAPEQATADPHQDHRVDIYALGVLGYELLTGRAPFSATTAQEMLAAHVTAVPDPVEKYRATVSPALAAVVMKCLAKKPADRWQSAEEVLQHLEPLATPSGGITPAQTPPVQAARMRRRSLVIAAGGGAVAVAALGLLAYHLLSPRPLNITAYDITPVTSEPGREFQPAISPDGSEVAYVAGPIWWPRLFVRSTVAGSGGAELRLADTSLESEWLPVWSADGQYVRFRGCPAAPWGVSFWSPSCTWRQTIKVGGKSRPVAAPPRALSARNLAWSPDDARVAFAVAETIFVSSPADTLPRRLAIHTLKFSYLHSFTWSPDGKLIAYVNGNPGWQISGMLGGSSIWIVKADGGPTQEVVGDEHLNVSPTWLDARHLLFVSNRDGPRGVYVIEVGSQGRRGEPHIVPGVADPHSISYSISAHKLAFAKSAVRQNIWAYPLGRSSAISIKDGRQVTSGNQVAEDAEVSPDGKWVVYSSNFRGNSDLYKMPIGGGDALPLTSLPGDEGTPSWSPDGREIAFYASTPGSPGISQIMIMPADGGRPSTVTSGPGQNILPTWSPSGLSIAFASSRGGGGLWILSRDSVGGPWHEAVRLTDFMCYFPAWAPDGRGVLCMTGKDLVLVSPDGRVLSRTPLRGYYWALARDGRTIYKLGTMADGQPGIWAMPVGGGVRRPVVVFDAPALSIPGRITVDNDHVYTPVWEHESDIWVADLRW